MCGAGAGGCGGRVKGGEGVGDEDCGRVRRYAGGRMMRREDVGW